MEPEEKQYMTVELEYGALRVIEPIIWALYPGKCRSALGDLTGSMPKPADGWLTMPILIRCLEYGADISQIVMRIPGRDK